MKKILIGLFLLIGFFGINKTFAMDIQQSTEYPGEFHIISGSYDYFYYNGSNTYQFFRTSTREALFSKSCNQISIYSDHVVCNGISTSFPYSDVSFYDTSESLTTSSFTKYPLYDTEISGSLASSINAISTNTSTESNGILTGPTGILIGSLLGLIVVVIVVRKLYEVFKGK